MGDPLLAGVGVALGRRLRRALRFRDQMMPPVMDSIATVRPIRQTCNLGHVQARQPVGNGIAGVLAGGQIQAFERAGVSVEGDPCAAVCSDVARALHSVVVRS